MRLNTFEKSPFQVQISFHKLIQVIEEMACCETPDFRKEYYLELLKRTAVHPEIVKGMTSGEEVLRNASLLEELLDVLFPKALTDNEIKAVSMPFQNLIFNHSARFKKILSEAGHDFQVSIRDFDQHTYYVACCCIIMNYYFKKNFDISTPFFIDIPDAKGFMRHYKVMYNADFVEVIPTAQAKMLTEAEMDELEDNYGDLELWMSKFPPESWLLKGFGLINLVDVTTESALSFLKSNFLKSELETQYLASVLGEVFSSIFKVPNLKVGFSPFEIDENTREEFTDFMGFPSYTLNCSFTDTILCKDVRERLYEDKVYFSISDLDSYDSGKENDVMCAGLREKGIRSCIFAPIVIQGKIEGVLEIVSDRKRALHSVNAQKLESVMPIIIDTFERVQSDLHNQIEAIIQREYTTIHPSVYWKFVNEARKNYFRYLSDKEYLLKEIVFDNVFPLYGGVDIKGSTYLRNKAVVQDLSSQLKELIKLMQEAEKGAQLILFEKRILRLSSFLKEIEKHFYTGLEREIEDYIQSEIHPFIRDHIRAFRDEVHNYFKRIDSHLDMYYYHRKHFDQSVGKANRSFSDILDKRQIEIQSVFPHYYESYKTDGIEHNMYIGASIVPQKIFDEVYLQNLRLWQLQVFSEILIHHYQTKESELKTLEVTALLLTYDVPVSIRFRMDEKRFDIDGILHTRYEVIKKRLDKAKVKNSAERVVQPQKIAVVFVNPLDVDEYLKYIKFLQENDLLLSEIEHFEVEDLQSVSGLKGIRVAVNLKADLTSLKYDDLIHRFLKDQYL